MTKEELQKRITAKKEQIEKINRRIDKWSKGLRPADIAVCEPFGNCIYGTAPRSMSWRDYHGTPEYQEARRNYEQYVKEHDNDIPRSDDWNKGPNIGELYSAYRDLGEASYTLNKYENELKNIDKFDSEEKIQILWDFLQNWKKESNEYYHKNASLYGRLNSEYTKSWEEFKKSDEYKDDLAFYKSHNFSDWRADYAIENKFKKNYYEDVDSFTLQISDRRGKVDEEKLTKYLDKEVRRKYERLVQEVTEKAGEILDASNLRISGTGEISGVIKGSKNNVHLWATLSGGEVQRLHYRSYCHIIK